jgi:hypothetical protein
MTAPASEIAAMSFEDALIFFRGKAMLGDDFGGDGFAHGGLLAA